MERRVAVISDAAKGQRAAAEHGAFAPFQAGSQIYPAVVEFFVGKQGRSRQDCSENIGWSGQTEIPGAAGIDVLVCVPTFGLEEPIAALKLVVQGQVTRSTQLWL